MSGYSRRFRTTLLAVLGGCAIILQATRAECGQVVISGTVTVDGAKSRGVTLEVVSNKGRLAVVESDEEGRYSVTVDVPEVTQVALRSSDNRPWYGTGAKGILAGQAVAQVSDLVGSKSLDVQLKSVAMTPRSIRVLTEDNRRVAGLKVKCKAELVNPSQPGIPPRTVQWTAVTASDGTFSVVVPKRGTGLFTFKLNTFGKEEDKARYFGKKEISFELLRDVRALGAWVVKRNALSMEVRFRWDGKFSREPFRPDVFGADFRHTVILNGPGRTITRMNLQGVALFYALPPGEYTVELSKGGKEIYRVTKTPSSVKISAEQETAVEVEVLIVPVKIFELSGTIVDSSDGSGVAGAVVTAAGSAVKTAKNGSFYLEGVRQGSAMTIKHPSYSPTSLVVAKAGDQGEIKIKSFPSVSGTVFQGTSESGVPHAVLYFRSARRDLKVIADRKGRYTAKLPAGAYELAIKRRFQPEHGSPPLRKSPKVTVHESRLDVPPEGLKKDFRVGAVGRLIVKIAGKGDPKEKGLGGIVACLVTPSDNKLVTARPFDRGKRETVIVAKQGKYRLLLVRNEQFAQSYGEVTLAAGAAKEVTITLGKWKTVRITDDRKVEIEMQ